MAKRTYKLPKRLAGVKIPKVLRKSDIVRAILENPTARVVVAEALVAAAGAAAAALSREGAGKMVETGEAAAAAGGRLASATSEAVRSAVGSLGHAVTEVARHVMPGEDDRDDGRKVKKHGRDAGREAARDRGDDPDAFRH